jgi:hypothetical protein
MAFDTAFNITWNQRVNKEETSMLKFLDKRKKEEEALTASMMPPRERRSRRTMSDADLMSAVRNARSDVSGSGAGAPSTGGGKIRLSGSDGNLRRGRTGSSVASGSVLQKAGSSVSSPSTRGKKAPPMTFEQMQEQVFNQSMNRYIKDLEKEAKEGQAEAEWTKQKIKDGLQQQVDEKTKARELSRLNGLQVQQQIEENKGRRATTRKSFVEAASAHNFPLFTETFISQDEVEQYRKDVKRDFRVELDAQNQVTQTLKNILVKKDRLYAADKMATNIAMMQADHAKVHHEQVRKGNEMMRVWDRDIRLKNIKNAILNGKDATQMVNAG